MVNLTMIYPWTYDQWYCFSCRSIFPVRAENKHGQIEELKLSLISGSGCIFISLNQQSGIKIVCMCSGVLCIDFNPLRVCVCGFVPVFWHDGLLFPRRQFFCGDNLIACGCVAHFDWLVSLTVLFIIYFTHFYVKNN